MADKKISEQLFEAVDVIIGKRLEAVQKDKTILCVVEDATDSKKGEYIVSNSAAKFTAYSENTSYVQGQNVWVLIPEGDYNNEKKIIGKYVGDSSTPYVWVNPMDSYADMTGDVLGNIGKTERGILANYNAPINIVDGHMPNGATNRSVPYDPLTDTPFQLDTGNIADSFINLRGFSLNGYDRMGISADFRTNFGTSNPLNGNYGLVFVIETEKIITIAENNNERETSVTQYIPVYFDSSDMWGNPYNYNVPFTQSLCFDIDPNENGTPVGIVGYFYQSNNFNNVDGMLPYYYDDPLSDPRYQLLENNIFVSNIQISFGYAADKVKKDTLYIYTPNSRTYVVRNDPVVKTLNARFVHVKEDGTSYAINDNSSFRYYKENDADFNALNPSLHWYRFKREEGVSDDVAGDFWEEITEEVDHFEISVTDFLDLEDERFKCVIFYTLQDENHPTANNKYVSSDPIIFTNEENPYDASRDLEQALRISPKGTPNGVFNLYEASYSANNNLINPADKTIPRYMSAVFYPAIQKTHMMAEVTRVAWYIPKENTMISAPAQSDYNINIQRLLTSSNDIDAWLENAEISEEEEALFRERIDDYYIVVNTNIPAALNGDEITLAYYIEPTLIKYKTNNTIYASAYYYQRVYEGNNAHYELTFGTKGTNGTNYTLLLDIIEETANDTVYAHPMAWTIGNTQSMKLKAELYDVDDQLVPDVTYHWRIKGSNTDVSTNNPLTISSVPDTGIIYECIATRNRNAEEYTQFTGYLIIPTRTSRDYIAMEGPSVVRYNSSGTNPVYYNKPYSLIKTDKTVYNTTQIRLKATDENIASEVWKYYPLLKVTSSYRRHLVPTGMYFHGVNYDILYIEFATNSANSTNILWRNPLLIMVDPYGNSLLNNWNGNLIIDENNNTIMSAIMGAGKKESNNTFTGLLLGDLPKASQADPSRTGLLGYEHGEQTYGIFDDGTMFLGKSSTAQITFNGTDGYIQNAGYGPNGFGPSDDGSNPNTNGIRINFSGATTTSQASMGDPYIHIRKAGSAEIVLNTGGPGPYGSWENQFVKIRGAEDKDLLHIGNDAYYLQTANYNAPKVTNGVLTNAGHGMRIDLQNGTVVSYDSLTLQGGGLANIGETRENNNNYPIWQSDSNNPFVYLSNQLFRDNPTVRQTVGVADNINNVWLRVGDKEHTDWKMVIGNNFGVRENGEIVASGGYVGGWSLSRNQLQSGGVHFYSTDQYNNNGEVVNHAAQSSGNKNDWRIYIHESGHDDTAFGVDKYGNFYANGGNIKKLNASNITAGTMSANYIYGGTINGNNVTVTNLNASNITSGTLSTDRLNVDEILANSAILGNMRVYDTAGVSIGYTKEGYTGVLSVNGTIYSNGSLALGYGSGQQSGYIWLTATDIAHLHRLWDAYGENA